MNSVERGKLVAEEMNLWVRSTLNRTSSGYLILNGVEEEHKRCITTLLLFLCLCHYYHNL